MEQDNLFEFPMFEGIPIMEFPDMDFDIMTFENEAKEKSMEFTDTFET